MKQLRIITSDTHNPYLNLALEEYLAQTLNQETAILFLWQNENTIVIGKNQIIENECCLEEIRKNNVKVARRNSGGGAVYHDLGNLNFSFIMPKERFSVSDQMQVILNAVEACGISAKKNGRNDLTVEEKKFSGHAFYSMEDVSVHHGTIMVTVDIAKMSLYLTPALQKLQNKGISSVKSRVTNLVDYVEELSISKVAEQLKKEFCKMYKAEVEIVAGKWYDDKIVQEKKRYFESKEWINRITIGQKYTWMERFSWGLIQVSFDLQSKRIKNVSVASDSLDTELIEQLGFSLEGCSYEEQEILAEMKKIVDNEIILNDLLHIVWHKDVVV